MRAGSMSPGCDWKRHGECAGFRLQSCPPVGNYAGSATMRELLSYSFVMPPTIFIVGCLAGALIGLVRPRMGMVVVLTSSILLYLFATPAVSTFLADELVMSVPTSADLAGAQAIVVLGGDYKLGDG